ncbi:Zan [Symbiodinium microadriaticum]|nr:Zan [Symbiodinium microadriaticum]
MLISTLLKGAVLAVIWVALGPVLAGLLQASAHVSHHNAAAHAAKYRGVHYHKRGRVFEANLQVGGGPGYIGHFKNAKQAAEAYDREVRRMYPEDTPDHKFRRKNFLNFPSEQEAAYTESPERARKRGLKLGGSSFCKEARSFELLREAFCESPYSENYELVRLTGSSKADALFKPRGSPQVGLQVQLKAATSGRKQGKTYKFGRLLGYDGMLVFLVALDGGHFWAASGEEFKTCHLQITIGCASDTCRRVEDTGARLVACFKNTRSVFDRMNWSLMCPREHQTTVDSLLEDDFDLLVACVLNKDQLQGAFLIPISELVQKGFVANRQKYIWQLDWFLDLRTWRDSEELPEELQGRLERLGYGGEDVPVPTSPVASDDGYAEDWPGKGVDVPIPTSPVDSPAGEDRRPAVYAEDREVPVPTSPVQSPADDDEHRPPVVPVSSGLMSSGYKNSDQMGKICQSIIIIIVIIIIIIIIFFFIFITSADEPTESPSEEVHEGPGEEPPSFEEVEFLLDEAALRGSASASSGIGPISGVEVPEEVPHPDSALPTSSAPADLFPDDSTEPSSPMQAVNPPTSPVTSPAEEMEFVDEGSAATGLPSGSLFDSAKLRESVPVHTSSVYVTSPTEIVPTDLPAPTSPVTSPADEVETQTIREALLPQLQQEVHTEMPVPTEMPSPSAAYDEDEEADEFKRCSLDPKL